MSVVDCERTDEVLGAWRRGGALGGQQAEHVADCADCATALAGEAALRQLGATLERLASPPDAGQILFRAELRRSAAAAERATRPMRLWGRFVGVGCAAGTGILAVTRGGSLWHHLTAASPTPAPAAVPPLVLVAAAVSLGLASLLLYLHSSWNES